MSYIWSVISLNLLLSLQILECGNTSDIIQNSINGASFVANTTRLGLKKTVDAVVGAPFKPFEVVGTQLENAAIGATSAGGKIIDAIGQKVKTIAQKLQNQEEKFIKCVQSQQFDAVKVIVLDEVKCVTSKFDTIHTIIHSTVVDVNITYNIVKDVVQLPKCGEDAKCFADYTSGFIGKLGRITLGIGSIVQASVFGLASIPVTLPVCFVMKSTLNPAEVIGKLIFNILKCSTA
ncbi:hypothetical protein WA026_005480 [Henosepilachna vigintioctopunctata]|uniref:Uncharacterized protein n=1 Tax=Henosepilachna vigintioctopunctata TaxID=420089 RepID=A0AAW1U218_9CUCU